MMAYRTVGSGGRRRGRLAALATALLVPAAAGLLLVPAAPAASALSGDDPLPGTVDDLDEALDDPVEDVSGTVADTAGDVTDTLTSAAEEAAVAAEDAADVTTEVVDDSPATPAAVETEEPAQAGDAGGDAAGATSPAQDAGTQAPEQAARVQDVPAEEEAADSAADASRQTGRPAGGFALIGLRSMLAPGTDPVAGEDVPPPLVSDAETVEEPLVAGREELASIRVPPPPPGGWPTTASGAGGRQVPTPMAVTAGSLLLLVGVAHALHAAGYLRPSFVRAPG